MRQTGRPAAGAAWCAVAPFAGGQQHDSQPHFFEDTCSANQHMTYSGSRMASHKLAQFLEGHQTLGRDLVFKGLPNESVKSGQTFLQFRITNWPAELPDPSSIDLVTTWEVELPEKGRIVAPTKLRHERHLSTPDVQVFRTVLIAGAQLKSLRDIGLDKRSN